jgi:5-methylthioadenosine/S-adenosylhomocysteine deaminase
VALEPPEGIRIVELGEAILMPGLVNVHAHAELAMFRGALEGLPFREWIVRLVAAKRAVLSEEDSLQAARLSCIEALRAGVTTLACTESSAGALTALAEAGLRGIVYQEVFGPGPAQAETSISELRERVNRLREMETELVRLGISPHAPFTVSDALYSAAADLGREEELPMALHIAESADEWALVTRGEGDFASGLRARGIDTPPRGRSPIELLDRLGVLRARPLLIHCIDVDGDDIRRIVDSGSSVAHCPIANAKLGHGVAPLPELLAGGAIVGVGTDSVASNNRMDILEEARVAALLQRARLQRADVLNPEELLRLCTVGGARALGLEERIGTLAPGMDADLCAVSIAGPHARPVHDPLTTLFHSAHGGDVILTVVRGRTLYASGTVTTLDEPATLAAVEKCAVRLRAVW